jgi:23S rRNA A2030 N6-methylase RlmJ
MAPRGSGHPDLSQRARREAPGMLTGLAILERELGMTEYEQHRLRRRLAQRLPVAEADGLRRQLAELEARRKRTLELLDELHEEYDQRVERSIEGIRARAARSPGTRVDGGAE